MAAKFTVANSGFPSPSRSPIATEEGWLPVARSVWAAKLPVPVPGSTETVLAS